MKMAGAGLDQMSLRRSRDDSRCMTYVWTIKFYDFKEEVDA